MFGPMKKPQTTASKTERVVVVGTHSARIVLGSRSGSHRSNFGDRRFVEVFAWISLLGQESTEIDVAKSIREGGFYSLID